MSIEQLERAGDKLLHVRFDGRSEELNLDALNLSAEATDAQIKQALEQNFDLSEGHLQNCVVVRTSRAIIVRPEAIYG